MTLAFLADVSTFTMGQAPPGSACNKNGVGTVFVKAGEFGVRYPETVEWTTAPQKLAKAGDTLVCVVGATAGKVNQAIDCAIGRSAAAVRADPLRLDQDYLYRFLQTKVSELRHVSQGLAQGVITREMLGSQRIPLPPLPKQRRIAAILDQADALRRLRRQSLTRLAHLIASLATSASLEPGGKTIPLHDAFWFQEGPGVRNWQFADEGVKLLNVSNVTKEGDVDLTRSGNRISYQEAQGKYAHFLVDAGDLLMPCSGIPIDTDGLLRTRAAFADASHLPLCMNTSTIRFKAKREPRDLIFLRSWLQTEEFRQQITKLVTGTAQKNFGPSHLKQINVTLPSKLAMAKLEGEMGRAEILKIKALSGQDRLDNLFASLQHRAFNGEL